MIRYLRRNEIDEVKYDNCIQASINSRVYAFSWYLDIVADNWDALILNNYEAVMPLPWRSKYFIKYIYPPAWTQQLGVFSKEVISEELILKFIKAIPRKFKKITIQFNSENSFHHKGLTERVNYILPLDEPYEEIFKGFKRDRKYRINQSRNFEVELCEGNINDLISTGEKYYSYLNISKLDYEKLVRIGKLKQAFIISAFLEDDFLGGVLFLKSNNRITYLFSVANSLGKEKQVISLIINSIYKKYHNTNTIFDFEGSMIEGIADFYKSFGAGKEVYWKLLKKNI